MAPRTSDQMANLRAWLEETYPNSPTGKALSFDAPPPFTPSGQS